MSEPIDGANARLGIDITSTQLFAAVISGDGTVSYTGSTARDREGSVVDQVNGLARELSSAHGTFAGVGLAVPGLIDRDTGRVAYSTNIPEHADVDLAGEVGKALGIGVVLENDANAAAWGEFHFGAGRGAKDMFYATLGEGVGGAFIFGGKLWGGAGGYAGEFGYIPINSEGMKLEDVASTANIIRRTKQRFHQDSTSSLSRLSEEGITIGEIIAAAEHEDGFAQMMLERTGTYVGVALATVVNLLNIERIVIGGEIIHTKQLVLDAVIQEAGRFSFRRSFETTSILEGELASHAAAIGAAHLSTGAI